MKTLYSFLFLLFFILTAVLVIGNYSYMGEFFFLASFEGTPLAYPFLGFACLGMLVGIFLLLSLKYMFSKADKNIDLTEESSK